MLKLLWRILGGAAVGGIGFLFAWKTEWFLKNFGRVTWAEIKFGEGGTRTFYKLLGVIFLLIGLMIMTGLFGGLLVGTVGRLFVQPT